MAHRLPIDCTYRLYIWTHAAEAYCAPLDNDPAEERQGIGGASAWPPSACMESTAPASELHFTYYILATCYIHICILFGYVYIYNYMILSMYIHISPSLYIYVYTRTYKYTCVYTSGTCAQHHTQDTYAELC